jgi:hypothetical protein
MAYPICEPGLRCLLNVRVTPGIHLPTGPRTQPTTTPTMRIREQHTRKRSGREPSTHVTEWDRLLQRGAAMILVGVLAL